MAIHRFDKLAMNRAANAGGEVNALLLKQEVAPEDVLGVTRRTGTLRQEYYAATLGALIVGSDRTSCWYPSTTLNNLNGSWSIGCSVKFGGLHYITTAGSAAGATSLPLITVRSLTNPKKAYELYTVDLAGSTKLKMECTVAADGSGALYSSLGASRALNSTDTLVFQWDHSSETLRVKTKGGTTGAETITLDCSSLATNADEKFVVEFLGYDGIEASKESHQEHVISNITIYTAYLSNAEIAAVAENRSPSNTNLKHHFKMSEGGQVVEDSKTSSSHVLFAHPTAPLILNNQTLFNGRASALRVGVTEQMEQYFTSRSNSNPRVGWGGFVKFTLLKDPSLGEQVIWDAGDWFRLKIKTTGYLAVDSANLAATMETTSSHHTALAAGTEYTIYFGVVPGTGGVYDPSSAAAYVQVGSGTMRSATFTDSIYEPPVIDFSAQPKFYLGADGTESDDTKLGAALTRFALYREFVLTDAGVTKDSMCYFTGEEFKDKSPNNTPFWPLIHSSVSSTPVYTAGALEDGSHVSVAGGHVLGEAGIIGLTRGVQRLTNKFKTDADTLRIGSKLLVASNKVGHIFDENAETVRPYGVPVPARNVSTRASAPGVLSGAASYGYRYVTGDGTYGPMERTDPVAITNGDAGRFIIGSDQGGGSALGDESGKTDTGTTESMGAHTGSTNPFSVGDDICLEVLAKMEEFEPAEVYESIWDRGLEAAEAPDGNDLSYRSEDAGNVIDISDDFTLQVSFKYSVDRRNSYKSDIGIFGITGGTNQSHYVQQRLPGLAGWISTGADKVKTSTDASDDITRSYYGTTGTGSGAGRLVIGIPRNDDHFEYVNKAFGGSNSNYNGVYAPSGHVCPWANWKPLTFTNDAGMWIDGNDYTIFVVRSGPAIKVYVHNATTGAFTKLTGRSMNALAQVNNSKASGVFAAAESAYTESTFFNGYFPASNTGSRFSVLATGWAGVATPYITTDGQVQESFAFTTRVANDDEFAKVGDLITGGETAWWRWRTVATSWGMDSTDGHPFHFRVWDRAIASAMLEQYGHRRHAAGPGQALEGGNVVDTHMFFEDLNAEVSSFEDKKNSGIVWKAWSPGATSATLHDVKTFTQTVSYGDAKKQPILIIGEQDDHKLEDAPLSLYYSSTGDGSIILELNHPTEGTIGYRLSHTLESGTGADPQLVKLFADYVETVNEFDEWNMFSIGIHIGTAGELIIKGMAINGNIIFNQTISKDAAPVENYDSVDWITLGGHTGAGSTPANNLTTCYIGEFRLWENEKGPSNFFTDDIGSATWKVNERLNSTEAADTHLYYRFQSRDLTSLELLNKGSLASGSTLTFDAGVTIHDERTASGDPVGFPLPPRSDIVAIELFRTITVGIVDRTSDTDIQDALELTRNMPLYFVDRLVAGTTVYTDDTPDELLGFAAPYTDYSVPADVKQFFTWQGMLGVLGESNRIYYTEPGPYGWETFPLQLTYEARIAGGGAGDLLACRSTGDTLYLFGKNWTTALIGAPGNETEFSFGGGIGAHSPRATVDIAGVVYAFNGRLWTVDRVGQVDFKIADVGQPFQDLLPTHSNVRLSCVSSLQSLFIIDENTGDVIRVFLPTGEATVEKRDAVAVTDNSNDEDLWVNVGGSYSKGSSTVYADDVDSDTTTHSAGTLSTSNVRFDCSTTIAGVNPGMRVGIVDASGNTLDTRVVSVAGNNVTVASVAGLAADSAGTIYFGVSSDGMLLDTGYIDSGNMNAMLSTSCVSLHQGTNSEIGLAASPVIGSRESIADAQFVTVSTNQERVGANLRGRFVRGILRNRVPENTDTSYLDIEITSPYEK